MTLREIVTCIGPRPFVNAAVVLGALAALLIGSPPQAGAEPNDFAHDAAMVCRWLDVDSSPASVQLMFEDMTRVMTQDQATEIAAYALTALCPEHVEAIREADEEFNGPRKDYAS